MRVQLFEDTDSVVLLVLKVGRVAIITRGRYAGKKVNRHLPRLGR